MKNKKEKKLCSGIINLEKMTSFDKSSQDEFIKWLEKEIKNYRKTQSEFVKQNIIAEILLKMIALTKKDGFNLEKNTEKLFKKFDISKS